MLKLNDCSLTVANLHDCPELLKECCDFLNEEWGRSPASRLQMLTKNSQQLPNSLLLLEQNGENVKIIGHSRLSRILEDRQGVWIASVLICPKERGKGLGKYLMMKSEEYAKMLGLSTAYLNTLDKQGFYEHIGYTYCSSNVVTPVTSSINGKFLANEEFHPVKSFKKHPLINLSSKADNIGKEHLYSTIKPQQKFELNSMSPPPPTHLNQTSHVQIIPKDLSKDIVSSSTPPPPPPPPPPPCHLSSNFGVQINGFKNNFVRSWMKKSLS